MGEFADVKRNRLLKFLRKLDNQEGFIVDTSGNHQWIIKHKDWLRPYPISFNHNKLKSVYVKDILKRVSKISGISIIELKKWF